MDAILYFIGGIHFVVLI